MGLLNEKRKKSVISVAEGASEKQPDIGKKDSSGTADEKPTALQEALDWMHSVVWALVACILIFIFVGRVVCVDGSSMEPTLHDGNKLIISNLFYTPEQGDIVVIRKLTFREEPIIKRVIATEGQTVNIDFDLGVVYVDGKALSEPYIFEPTQNQLDFDDEITVPEGCVFVMGDNRNHSTDSRDSRIGCVDTRNILGRVIIQITPLSKFGRVD